MFLWFMDLQIASLCSDAITSVSDIKQIIVEIDVELFERLMGWNKWICDDAIKDERDQLNELVEAVEAQKKNIQQKIEDVEEELSQRGVIIKIKINLFISKTVHNTQCC